MALYEKLRVHALLLESVLTHIERDLVYLLVVAHDDTRTFLHQSSTMLFRVLTQQDALCHIPSTDVEELLRELPKGRRRLQFLEHSSCCGGTSVVDRIGV